MGLTITGGVAEEDVAVMEVVAGVEVVVVRILL